MAADTLLNRLLENRIMPGSMQASADLFTRFHAHTRYLGKQTGYGYEHWYNAAIDYAVEQDEWPVKLVEQTVTVSGVDISVDVRVPESSKRATNKNLLTAYEVIQDGAREHGVFLPEHELGGE